MWNLVAGNHILDKRAKYKAHLRHIQALQTVKSTINNSAPVKPIFLQLKQKTKQLEQQRKDQIQSNNNLLVHKMNVVSAVIGDHNDIYYKVRSLSKSKPYKKKQQRLLDEGNQMMIKKIHRASSSYQTSCILKDTQNYLTYKNNIMSCNKPNHTIFNVSHSSFKSHRPYSSYRRPFSAPRNV